jgi:putative glutamine amidotransferase
MSDSVRSSPRIGITTYRERAAWGVWDQPADLLPAGYADAVHSGGGAALLLPPGRPESAGAVLAGLDGLILAGGADVDPNRYGAAPHLRTDRPRPDRDEWEFVLAEAAIRRGTPVLGVCRGLQVLNVLLGGTLVQHLPDRVGTDAHCQAAGVMTDHRVRVDPASWVGSVVGPAAEVAAHHHQGVDRLADGLVAVGWAEDGVVEAVELPGPSWVKAVQWHPEARAGEPLVAAFVEICRLRADYETSAVVG